jgi:hypothetical protein
MLFMFVPLAIWVILSSDCDCKYDCDNPTTVPIPFVQPFMQPFVQPFVDPFINQIMEPFINLVAQPFVEQPFVEQPFVEQPFVDPFINPIMEPFINLVAQPFVEPLNPRFFMFNQTRNNSTTENNSININIKNNDILFHTYSY